MKNTLCVTEYMKYPHDNIHPGFYTDSLFQIGWNLIKCHLSIHTVDTSFFIQAD